MERLLEKECWVVMTYADGSKHKFRTTLNEQILREYGVTDLGECLYNVDRNKLEEINGTIDVFDSEPKLDNTNEYINRFL